MGHDPSIALPHVPGHELCGEVAEVGSAVRGLGGRRAGDGAVLLRLRRLRRPCRQGETQICERDFQPGFTAWGSFAEYVALPRADLNLVAVPEALSDVEAASLGCRFMTAWAALHVHGERARRRVGRGARLRRRRAGRGDDRRGRRRARGRGRHRRREAGAGARARRRARRVRATPVEAIRELTGGGAHVSIDALGLPHDVHELGRAACAAAGATSRSACCSATRATSRSRWRA